MDAGSTWGRWDLHIHTPASYEWRGMRLRDAARPEDLNRLLTEVVDGINASSCVAVGIMDYWTFDGVIALRRFLATDGAPQCNATLFPGIELRMVSPGDFRLNVHVLLNPNLSDEKLQAFKAQLKLANLAKPLTDDYLIDFARERMNDTALAAAGYTREEVMNDRDVALLAAQKCAEVTPESVMEALKTVGPQDAILFVPFDTNDGVKKIRFREHYNFPQSLLAMDAIFEVRDPGTRDAFVGTRTARNAAYFSEFQGALGYPKLAVRGSDAHQISDYGKFHGDKATWIKAAPSFEGLLQACREPCNRSFVGEVPPKCEFLCKNPQLFIQSLQLRKRPDAAESGHWFDQTILSLNPDLVAVIGRKGSGKSALADVLGLVGDTPNEKYFSFLSDQRFRLPKDNKARSFEAQLQWHGDTRPPVWRALDQARASDAVQRIKYLPQRYFEELCNDHVKGDDNLLQAELRAVIFSHIPSEDRQGARSLDELIRVRTEVVEAESARIRAKLQGLNRRVIELDQQTDPDEVKRLRETVRLRLLSLRKLKDSEPDVGPAPAHQSQVDGDSSATIATITEELRRLEQRRIELAQGVEQIKIKGRATEDALARAQAISGEISRRRDEMRPRLAALGIELDSVFKCEISTIPLEEVRQGLIAELRDAQSELDSHRDSSVANKIELLQSRLKEERERLHGPLREHQTSVARHAEWEREWLVAIGATNSGDSFRSLWGRLKAIPHARRELESLKRERLLCCSDLLNALHSRASILRELFSPVQMLVQAEPEISDALGVAFSVRYSFDAFITRLFDYVKQNTGSFYGVEESKAFAQRLLADDDLTTQNGLLHFLGRIEEALYFDIRAGSDRRRTSPSTLLRSDRTLDELYDFIYGLEYADLSYGLMLGNVELERLSPGQRGALLLIFYLLVDKEKMPIVLDQPEENLDNETVYKLLVGVITRAKRTRQVIMVTHNANLAVACDAEQLIVCSMDRDGPNRITYQSGSIEQLHIRDAVVSILEGTQPAFDNRRRKYQ